MVDRLASQPTRQSDVGWIELFVEVLLLRLELDIDAVDLRDSCWRVIDLCVFLCEPELLWLDQAEVFLEGVPVVLDHARETAFLHYT